MAGLAEAIVIGNKLYRTGKQVAGSVKSVGKSVASNKAFNSEQKKVSGINKKPVSNQQQKNTIKAPTAPATISPKKVSIKPVSNPKMPKTVNKPKSTSVKKPVVKKK